MADYTAVVRTNYFHVTDEEKYRELLGMLESDYFVDFTEMKDANKVFFVFTLLLFGVVSGSSILTAQYFGKNDCVASR